MKLNFYQNPYNCLVLLCLALSAGFQLVSSFVKDFEKKKIVMNLVSTNAKNIIRILNEQLQSNIPDELPSFDPAKPYQTVGKNPPLPGIATVGFPLLPHCTIEEFLNSVAANIKTALPSDAFSHLKSTESMVDQFVQSLMTTKEIKISDFFNLLNGYTYNGAKLTPGISTVSSVIPIADILNFIHFISLSGIDSNQLIRIVLSDPVVSAKAKDVVTSSELLKTFEAKVATQTTTVENAKTVLHEKKKRYALADDEFKVSEQKYNEAKSKLDTATKSLKTAEKMENEMKDIYDKALKAYNDASTKGNHNQKKGQTNQQGKHLAVNKPTNDAIQSLFDALGTATKGYYEAKAKRNKLSIEKDVAEVNNTSANENKCLHDSSKTTAYIEKVDAENVLITAFTDLDNAKYNVTSEKSTLKSAVNDFHAKITEKLLAALSIPPAFGVLPVSVSVNELLASIKEYSLDSISGTPILNSTATSNDLPINFSYNEPFFLCPIQAEAFI